jgi:hypothetical protein
MSSPSPAPTDAAVVAIRVVVVATGHVEGRDALLFVHRDDLAVVVGGEHRLVAEQAQPGDLVALVVDGVPSVVILLGGTADQHVPADAVLIQPDARRPRDLVDASSEDEYRPVGRDGRRQRTACGDDAVGSYAGVEADPVRLILVQKALAVLGVGDHAIQIEQHDRSCPRHVGPRVPVDREICSHASASRAMRSTPGASSP